MGLNVLPPDFSLSIRYSLPNKLFEYQMAGVPVLSSELDATAEVVRIYDVGRVVSSLAPADVDSAINTMPTDGDALTRMRRNALDAVQHELRWEKETSHLIHFYTGLWQISPNRHIVDIISGPNSSIEKRTLKQGEKPSHRSF